MTEAIGVPTYSSDQTDTDAMPILRRIPYPFKAMLAICSDINQTRIDVFRETHRFLNTREHTSMGPGVGLDIANSLWLYKPPHPKPDRNNIAYFTDLSWERLSPYAAEIMVYARAGWIDTLHSYGNFSRVRDGWMPFRRAHAERALEVLLRNNVRIPVWVNYGDRNNRQNIGDHEWMQGDRPEAPEYHADLLRAYGTEFIWLHIRTDQFGAQSLIREQLLRDGGHLFGFHRFQSLRNLTEERRIARSFGPNCVAACRDGLLPEALTPQWLKYQLSDEVLDTLVRSGHLCIVGQQLGSIYPMTSFDVEMVAAFRRLCKYQDDGLVLVARTSRLLHYNRVRDYLEFTCANLTDKLVIDIEAVADPVRGRWVPAMDDVRGIGFQIQRAKSVELRLAGKVVEPSEIVTAAADNETVIGIRWFGLDPTDYAAQFIANDRNSYLIWNAAARAEAIAENTRILRFLEGERERAPAGFEPSRYKAAADYAIRCYRRGLPYYSAILERIGFTEMRQALDIGSGAGHWCMAFLRHGARAVGIDRYPEYVELASQVARELGAGDRVSFAAQLGEEARFEPGDFDCAWSHSVLMFTDQEKVIQNVSRALAMAGPFYCGYTTEGDRLCNLHESLSLENDPRLTGRLSMMFSLYVRRSGIYNTSVRVGALTIEDMLRVCRVFGLEYVGQPGVQDGRVDYLGIPATFDFVVRKASEPEEIKSRLLKSEAIQTSWLEDLDQIARSGCASLVCDVFQAVDRNPADEERRHVYARALILANRAAGEEGRWMFDGGRRLSDHVIGLYRHDRGDYGAALAAYEQMDDAHPDKGFLIGACLLRGREFERTQQHFADLIEKGFCQSREWIGLAAAHHSAGDREGAIAAFRGLIESRRQAGVAGNLVDAELARLEKGR